MSYRAEEKWRDPATFRGYGYSCSHGGTKWVDTSYVDDDGEKFEDGREEPTTYYKDIDLHRMQCQQCGHVAYYSERARIAWETGVDDPNIHCFPSHIIPIAIQVGPRI